MKARKYVLDLNGVVRIDIELLVKNNLVKLLITRVNWNGDRDGNVTVFTPEVNLDEIKIKCSRDQLIRLVIRLIESLSEDARKKVLEELSAIKNENEYV